MNPFVINPLHKPYVHWIGNHEIPLFCIDNLYADPKAVKEFAFERQFPSSQAYYPGRHQPLESDVEGIPEFLDFMANLLSIATNLGIQAANMSTDFSIVTTPEHKLLGSQGQPHIDGCPMLGVIYLNNEDFGGTVFFRNRETGSMKVITPEERAHHARITEQRHDPENKHSFITGSDNDWERVEGMDGVNNRLVMWPGDVWHSINIKIPPEDGNLEDKRLTQRVIVGSL